MPPWVSIGALGVSLFSLFFTFRQWLNSIRKDRAWIVPGDTRDDNSFVNYKKHSGIDASYGSQEEIKTYSEANNRIRPIVQITNGGFTPALKFQTQYHWKIYRTMKFPQNPDYTDCKATNPGAFAVGRTVDRDYDDIQLSDSEWAEMLGGKSFLFIYGEATYKDVFQKDRITHWCYIYKPEHEHFERHSSYNDLT